MPVNHEMPEETPKLYDAFISYSHHDSGAATRLADELEQEGFVVWLDKQEVLVGHNVVEKVDLGMSDSRFMILLLSNSSIQSEWVKREWTASYVNEIESKDVVILPALVEPCDIPAVLKGKKYADLGDWDAGLQEIVTAMKGHSPVVAQRARRPVQARRSVVDSPFHFAVTPPRKSLSELFIGGLLFSSIPKAKFRNVSLLLRVGGQANVLVRFDNEDALMMEGVGFGGGLKWQWEEDCESIPCLLLSVDAASGEHWRSMLPTYGQVDRLLGGLREVILLFLLEDDSGTGITGVGMGAFGMQTLELRNAYVSFDV